MKKKWNIMGKMAVCSFAAMVMVMAGTGMKASAEMLMDGEDEIIQAEAVIDMDSEDEIQEALPEDVPEEQKAEDLGIDVAQIVVIEDSMVPGAAQPDFGLTNGPAKAEEPADETGELQEPEAGKEQAEEPEDGEEQAEEPEAGEPEEEVSGEVLEEAEDEEPPEEEDSGEPQTVPEEKSETGAPRLITYEDSEVVVTVAASEAAQLPADTEVKVTKLQEGSAKYEAAKEAARQSVGASENASYTFYDVALESEGQKLEVEDGTVSVKLEFKTEAKRRKVVSIEETESGKVARNVTDREAAEGKSRSVALSY